MLLEVYLGAMAGSKPEQDFAEIGIELKTIPIDSAGKAAGNHVCLCRPSDRQQRRDMGKQPCSPQTGARTVDPGGRGTSDPACRTPDRRAFAVEPSDEEEQQLRQDWEELMDLIVLGKVESITARHGEVLQLRPKGRQQQSAN